VVLEIFHQFSHPKEMMAAQVAVVVRYVVVAVVVELVVLVQAALVLAVEMVALEQFLQLQDPQHIMLVAVAAQEVVEARVELVD
jgi:hypothetical protein